METRCASALYDGRPVLRLLVRVRTSTQEVRAMHARFRLATAVVSLLLPPIGSLRAQETRGEILGRVTDSSEAVAPGVRITAVNTATQVRTSSVTNATGDYKLPFLNPGIYDLTAVMGGFKTHRQEGILVQVSTRMT